MSTWPDGPGVVELPDGVRVRGTSWRRRADVEPQPAFVCLLLARRPSAAPWPCTWVRWPDLWLPSSTDDALVALQQVHGRAARERVAVMCGGGVGRTGAALAVLAALGGVAPAESVEWVREHYHPRAVETPWQRRWVTTTAVRGAGRSDGSRLSPRCGG